VTMLSMLKPLILAAACMGLFTLACGEWVGPNTNQRLSYIERVHISKKSPVNIGEQWLRDTSTFLRLSPLTANYFSLTMFKVGEDSQWLERIDAAKAYYKQGAWHLEQAYVSRPDAKQGLSVVLKPNFVITTALSPETVAAPDPRDMQWFELYTFAQDLAAAGLQADRYLYQLNRKLALPVACLVMVLLAYSLCENMGSRVAANSKGLMIAITLALAFYIFGVILGMLVDGGRLPAIYAAWLPSLVFLGFSGYRLLLKEGY